MLRWIKRTSTETLPNGDPIYSYTLEFKEEGKWKTVPSFEVKRKETGQYYLIGADIPTIVTFGTLEEEVAPISTTP